MTTNKITEITEGPEIADSQAWIKESSNEKRDYCLNLKGAINKKLQATNKEDFVVTQTGGGIKFVLNTGTYEVFKIATEDFYKNESNTKITYKQESVSDIQNMCVETRYKASQGRTHLYTLNMYHTRCSCLVNGKKTSYFMMTDLQDILSIIQNNLSAENTNLTQVNSKIRGWLLDYCQNSDQNDQHTSTACATEARSSTTHLNSQQNRKLGLSALLEESFEGNKKTENNEVVHNLSFTRQCSPLTVHDSPVNIEDTPVTVPETSVTIDNTPETVHETPVTIDDTPVTVHDSTETDSSVTCMMKQLIKEVSGLKTTLEDHIDCTSQQINRIYDEISSVKKVCAVYVQNAERKVDSLTDKTSMVQNELQKIADTSLRRFKSISDQLKTLHESSKKQQLKESPMTNEPHHSMNRTNNNKTTTENLTTNKPQTTQQHGVTSKPQPQKNKTLIIGSSILKGVSLKGLDTDISVSTNRGAGIKQIAEKLNSISMKDYKNIVVYIGGNNISDGMPLQELHDEYAELIRFLKAEGCIVHLCSICPRRDTEVIPLNDAIKQLATSYSINYVDCYSSFVYGDGQTVKLNFTKDEIHLSQQGTSALLRAINKRVPILKRSRVLNQRRSDDNNIYHQGHSRVTSAQITQHNSRRHYSRRSFGCAHCGLRNHETRECRRNFW